MIAKIVTCTAAHAVLHRLEKIAREIESFIEVNMIVHESAECAKLLVRVNGPGEREIGATIEQDGDRQLIVRLLGYQADQRTALIEISQPLVIKYLDRYTQPHEHIDINLTS